ncbi:TetR/AcrR family transcriptional regulator [Glaciibacter superstes]|uniref:TetR/AcrR family transcriptional regulator n=1 Tax=Glaciibacter superstes TaxID=501023 RepID=UPI0004793555|nr:TetR/AcrR family transcriptional regulator [Glaciibacter superstes]
MVTESTGRGDADRSLMLLWRHHLDEPQSTRGPKQKTSVDEVVSVAIALADEEGLEALSMRRVAERLGLGVMSLYTYVPGKAELVDLMVDTTAGEQELPEHPGDVRSRLEYIARLQWELYRAHPWLLQIDTSRPPLGPHVSDRYEWQLRAVEGIGLDDIEMDQVVTLVSGFVAGPARAAADAERMRNDSGVTDAEWWEANAPVLERVMDGSRYPVSGRVGAAAGEAYEAPANPDLAFEFGLARVLDGVELLIASRA